MRYLIVRKYYVRREHVAAFVAAYEPDGPRAQLFRRAEGYLWTSLVRSAKEPNAFVTLDVWRSDSDFARFQTAFNDDYTRLGVDCAGYTDAEVPVFAGAALPGK